MIVIVVGPGYGACDRMSMGEGDVVSRRRGSDRKGGRRKRGNRAPREQIRLATAPPEHTDMRPTAETLLFSGMELFAALYAGLLSADVMPLYALLSAIYEALGHRPDYPKVIASAQLARALEHLGFGAELIPASVMLARVGQERIMDIGVWEHPPVMRDDGTTDGHVVVWADSFKRCIDLGPCNHPALIASSTDSENLTLPVVVHLAGGREELLDQSRAYTTLRLPFVMNWIFIPPWKSYFDTFLARHAAAVEDGGLAIAKVAVDLLSAIAVYSDMTEFNQRYPWLAELVSGQAVLSLPDGKSRLYRSDRGPSTDAAAAPPSVFRTPDE